MRTEPVEQELVVEALVVWALRISRHHACLAIADGSIEALGARVRPGIQEKQGPTLLPRNSMDMGHQAASESRSTARCGYDNLLDLCAMLRVRPARQGQLRRCDDAVTRTRGNQQARSQPHFVAQGQPIAL